MKGNQYTEDELALIKQLYPTHTVREIQKRIPWRTMSAIKTKVDCLKIAKDNPRHKFSESDIQYLILNYSNTTNAILAKYIGCSIHSVENKGMELGLKKDKNFISEIARDRTSNPSHPIHLYKFRKGHIPVNKGIKQEKYMSKKGIERSSVTRFKKGVLPKNTKPVGYESVRGCRYIWVKIAEPNVFKEKHRVIWEQHNGKPPKGFNVQFKDGNPLNCTIENLYLISRKDQLNKENSMRAKYPEEVQKAIRLQGKLIKQIKKYE